MDEARDPLFPARPPTASELPYDDGEPMESARHYEQMHLLTNTLNAWLGDREDWHVAGNRAVYFRAPDVFVVLDVPDGRRERLSWVAWEEGGRLPDVVVEIISESTEREDRGRKKDIYERVWRLPEYFLFEPFGAVLEGWELDPETHRYVKKRPDARGDLPVRQMNMALGVRPLACYSVPAPSLRWTLPDGTALPTFEELAEARRVEAEAHLAKAEAYRVEAETQRADARRAEADAQRAEADARRAEADAQRAEAETQRLRAEAAEAELARLRAKGG